MLIDAPPEDQNNFNRARFYSTHWCTNVDGMYMYYIADVFFAFEKC